MTSKNMRTCAKCGSEDLLREADHRKGIIYITCEECGHTWEMQEIVKGGRSSRGSERPRYEDIFDSTDSSDSSDEAEYER